jgi:uncharacterized OsmC-like protein
MRKSRLSRKRLASRIRERSERFPAERSERFPAERSEAAFFAHVFRGVVREAHPTMKKVGVRSKLLRRLSGSNPKAARFGHGSRPFSTSPPQTGRCESTTDRGEVCRVNKRTTLIPTLRRDTCMSESNNMHQFSITATGDSETKTTVSVRDFEFVVDEPTNLGGTNEGPNPVEYLLGAWAGCLNVVAQTVCDEHDVELAGLDIEVEGDLDPRKFMGMADEPRAGYQEIRVELTAETDTDPETLETIREEVEARCPVGDNIMNPTPIEVTIDAA